MTSRALIFDCDGVLADTEKDGHRVAFNMLFDEVGVPVHWSVAEYGALLAIGGGKERMRAALTPSVIATAGLPTDEERLAEVIGSWHRRKSELFRGIVADGRLPGRPGVARLAAAALADGWRIAVASTSAEESVIAVVDIVFPRDTAGVIRVHAGDAVTRKKPAPDIYLRAADDLQVQVARCVAIEDSPIGCRSATSAGMACVITLSEYTTEEHFDGASVVLSDLGTPAAPCVVRENAAGIDVDGALGVDHLVELLEPSPAPGKGIL